MDLGKWLLVLLYSCPLYGFVRGRSPAMAVDSAGNFVLAWKGIEPDGIFLQRFDQDGNILGSIFRADTGVANPSLSEPILAINGAGLFAVAWGAVDSARRYTQAYSANGSKIGGIQEYARDATSYLRAVKGSFSMTLDEENRLVSGWAMTESPYSPYATIQITPLDGSAGTSYTGYKAPSRYEAVNFIRLLPLTSQGFDLFVGLEMWQSSGRPRSFDGFLGKPAYETPTRIGILGPVSNMDLVVDQGVRLKSGGFGFVWGSGQSTAWRFSLFDALGHRLSTFPAGAESTSQPRLKRNPPGGFIAAWSTAENIMIRPIAEDGTSGPPARTALRPGKLDLIVTPSGNIFVASEAGDSIILQRTHLRDLVTKPLTLVTSRPTALQDIPRKGEMEPAWLRTVPDLPGPHLHYRPNLSPGAKGGFVVSGGYSQFQASAGSACWDDSGTPITQECPTIDSAALGIHRVRISANLNYFSLERKSDSGFTLTGNFAFDTTASGLFTFHLGYQALSPDRQGGFVAVINKVDKMGGNPNPLLMRMDSNLVIQWIREFVATGSEYAQAVKRTEDGQFLVSGFSNSLGSNYYLPFLLKTDSVGEPLWFSVLPAPATGSTLRGAYSALEVSDGFLVLGGEPEKPAERLTLAKWRLPTAALEPRPAGMGPALRESGGNYHLHIPTRQRVVLERMDIRGALKEGLLEGVLPPGEYSIPTRDWQPGLHLLSIKADRARMIKLIRKIP